MQDIPLDHEYIHFNGALDFDQGPGGGLSPRRLPAWTRTQVPAFMEVMVRQPSGVRIEFATDATQIELDVQLTRIQLADNPPRSASFDLVCDGQLLHSQRERSGNVLRIDLRDPAHPHLSAGEPGTIRFDELPPGLKQCQIWLPQAAQVEVLGLRVSTDAIVHAYRGPAAKKWLHYGSSISHCAEAISPTRTWPAVAAQLGGIDLTNLAFGGNCQLDQFVARTLRDLPADMISLKLGINIVNMDSMRERTFTSAVHGFIDTLRDGHPHTPLLIVSPIFCPSAETVPGPTLPDTNGKFVTFPGHDEIRAGCLTLTWIRKILSRLVEARRAAGDDNLHYLDGLELFGPQDADDLPDDLHPNGDGYVRMGQRFNEIVFATHRFEGFTA